MEEHDQDEGSLKKKVATGVAVGLATTAAAGVAKKLLESNNGDESDEPGGEAERGSRAQGTRARAQSTGSPRTSSSRSKQRSRATGRSSRTKSSSAKSGSTSSRSARGSSGSKKRTSGASRKVSERTKEQLYAQAKRLKIDGRSKMTKTQLERAIARAK